MARKRMIDPDIWTDEKILELSWQAVPFFIGLVSQSDDEGRLRFSAASLRAKICPRQDVTLDQVQAWMQEIVAIGLVKAYEVNGSTYAYHPKWLKSQTLKRPTPSKLPEPPGWVPPTLDESDDESGEPEYKKATIPAQVRRDLAALYGGQVRTTCQIICSYCGIPGVLNWTLSETWPTFTLEIDHVVSEFNGGATVVENLVLACRACNRSKKHRDGLPFFIPAKHPLAPGIGVGSITKKVESTDSHLPIEYKVREEKGNQNKVGGANPHPRTQVTELDLPRFDNLELDVVAYIANATAENKSGRMTLGREFTLRRELLAVLDELGSRDAFAYGLREANVRSKPNKNYVKACAKGWTERGSKQRVIDCGCGLGAAECARLHDGTTSTGKLPTLAEIEAAGQVA